MIILNGNGRNGAAAAGSLEAPRVRLRDRRHRERAPPGLRGHSRHVPPGFRAEGLRLARDLKVKVVGPLDGLKPAALMGGQLAVVLGN